MKAILHSLLSVIGGEAAVRAANFAAVLLIARMYGKVELGAYAASLAVVTVVVMFADNGLQTAAITQVSQETENRNQVIGQLAICKTILLALAAIVLFGVAVWTKQTDLFLATGIWVAARTIVQSYSQLQMSILKSVSLAKWIGMIQSAHSGFLFLGIG
ncbi:MAG TPA: oligosaccharide flippase family protein, partial [Candidatus Acidoferrum sp.]|nr:oligosaccharide flippase family protein [Candidatus Acidoferrum sp.]